MGSTELCSFFVTSFEHLQFFMRYHVFLPELRRSAFLYLFAAPGGENVYWWPLSLWGFCGGEEQMYLLEIIGEGSKDRESLDSSDSENG